MEELKDQLSHLVIKTPLNDKLLSRPPFRYLYDLISEINSKSLALTLPVIDYENPSKEQKVDYLNSIITQLNSECPAKPSKIIAGVEVENTWKFMSIVATQASIKIAQDDAKVKEKLKGKSGIKPSTSKDKIKKETLESKSPYKAPKKESVVESPSKELKDPKDKSVVKSPSKEKPSKPEKPVKLVKPASDKQAESKPSSNEKAIDSKPQSASKPKSEKPNNAQDKPKSSHKSSSKTGNQNSNENLSKMDVIRKKSAEFEINSTFDRKPSLPVEGSFIDTSRYI